MNAISGFGGYDPQAGFTPPGDWQKARDNIQAADTDQNGSISFAEAEASVKGTFEQGLGGSTDMLNNLFEKGDTNGDGELSEQEQQQMFNHMEEQIARMKSMMSPADTSGQGSFDSLQSLLDSLSTEEEEESSNSYSALNHSGEHYKLENQAPIDLIV